MTVAKPNPLNRGSSRDAILDAAGRIAREVGVLALSVDRVVAGAGVSKGSFFYHFPNKEAMISALLARAADAFDAKIQAWVDEGTPFHRALIAAAFDEVALNAPLLAVFVAAVATDRSMAQRIIPRLEAWNAQLAAEGIPPDRVRLLRLALDGLLLSSLLRTEPAPADELCALGASLEALVLPTARNGKS